MKERKQKRRILMVLGGVAGLGVLYFLSSLLGNAAPSIDRDTVWIGTVEKGPLAVQVRGIGTLVPEDLRWLTAQTDGVVEEILLLPGAEVEPESLILRLSNPELEQNLRNAELQLSSAEAQLTNQRVREEDTLLEMEFQLAQLQSQFASAELDVRVNEELFAEGLVAERDLLRSRLSKEQLERQTEILGRRLANRREQIEQNLAPAIAAVEQEKERVNLITSQVENLNVRAGISGVLQRLPFEEGQQVAPGTQLAQVADPARLKAVIRIPETQAKELTTNLPATVDTRNGIVAGIVSRVSPTVEGGTVDVDVRFTDELPNGARPDLTVEGIIELSNLSEVLYVNRPSFARENGSVGMYKLQPTGNLAQRVTVTFGIASVSAIEVRSGLTQGDRVILSDTTQYDDAERLRLN